MKRNNPCSYRHYLLVFWKENSARPMLGRCWRFRLEDPRTGKRWGYVKLAAPNDKLAQILDTLDSELDNLEE